MKLSILKEKINKLDESTEVSLAIRMDSGEWIYIPLEQISYNPDRDIIELDAQWKNRE